MDCNGSGNDSASAARVTFQSPNPRGMDCNDGSGLGDGYGYGYFQSPNPRGMDCNLEAARGVVERTPAFSPLILGEWIATSPAAHRGRAHVVRFQSPNPRGMDCNSSRPAGSVTGLPFLSVP